MPLAWAQATDPAGQYLRQQERERNLRKQLETTPDQRLPGRDPSTDATGRLPTQETPCVALKSITLMGDRADSFQWLLAYASQTPDGTPDEAVGRCVGKVGVNLIMRRMQNALIAQGYSTSYVRLELEKFQARLHAQGVLELTLFPGLIRQIRFIAGTSPRATQFNAFPVQSGDVLNLRDLEQALENFTRIPTVQAKVELEAPTDSDAQPGESDVIVQWQQDFPFRLNLSADDSGSHATGKYQGSATVSYDNWWTLNDLFYITFNHDLGGSNTGSQGTQGTTVHYSVPWGYGLLAITSSSNQYHQSVAGASQTYIYSGTSRNNEIKLSRVLQRDVLRKTTLSLSGWTRSSRNFIDDTELEVQRRRMAGWELGANHRELMGDSTLDFNLSYKRGTSAFGALSAPEEALGEGTARPKIIHADAQWMAPFALGNQRLRYSANWRAQWNRTPFVPQDRFAIGGRYTVRGFDGESLLSADRGWLIRNDLGWSLGASGQELYLGLDHGQVSGPSSLSLIGTRLTGAVVGLRGSFKNTTYDLFAGQPLHKPEGFPTARRVAGFNLNWSF